MNKKKVVPGEKKKKKKVLLESNKVEIQRKKQKAKPK